MKPAVSIAAVSLLLAATASLAFAFPPAASAPPPGTPAAGHATPLPLRPDSTAPFAPRHIPIEALMASMDAADSIQVGRVAVIWRDTTDLNGEKKRYPYTHRIAMVRVPASWMRRFTPALLNTSTNLSDELCPPPAEQPGGEQPWMTTVIWFSSKSRGQTYLNFFENCGFAGVGGRTPGGFWIDERADTLLGMMREALPADTVLRDYRAARRAAMAAAGNEALPKFGDYVRVDELPEAVTKVMPEYPAAARTAGIEGVVMVQALVGKDGQVKDMKLAKSVNGLDAAALVAVRQWKFKPAQAAGKPVAVWVAVPVEFKLK